MNFQAIIKDIQIYQMCPPFLDIAVCLLHVFRAILDLYIDTEKRLWCLGSLKPKKKIDSYVLFLQKIKLKWKNLFFVWIIIKLVSTSYFPIFVGNGGPVAMDTGLVEQFCWCHDPMVLGCYQYTKYHQILWGSISKPLWCLGRITLKTY